MNKEKLTIGTPLVLESDSPSQEYGVVFEDDGETAYFYALDLSRDDNPIVDALQIYSVTGLRGARHSVAVVWSADGLKAGLFLSDSPQAVFDFDARRGYCRTGCPEPDSRWTQHDHRWSDVAADLLR